LAAVAPPVAWQPSISSSRRISGIARGVVVTVVRARSPSRRPSIRLSQVASACAHLPISSHQAK
jgi:hypothetical protein